MAKLERVVYNESLTSLKNRIEREIVEGSLSASLEEESEFSGGDARCCVMVFERYSWTGGNRLSLTVTLFQTANGPVRVSGISTGGSQAMFFKINTLGEEAFLDKLAEILKNSGGRLSPALSIT